MRQTDPETERKRVWLNRYRESIIKQKRLSETLQELRSRSTSICAPLCSAKSAPTGTHSDRVADNVQRIADAEQRLQAEQLRGLEISSEIVNAAFDQLPLQYARALIGQYVDFESAEQTARKIGVRWTSITQYRRRAIIMLKLPEDAP